MAQKGEGYKEGAVMKKDYAKPQYLSKEAYLMKIAERQDQFIVSIAKEAINEC